MHPEKEFCTEYEKSKVLADRIALQAAADEVPITIVYPGVLYGPGKLTTGNLVSRIVRELSCRCICQISNIFILKKFQSKVCEHLLAIWFEYSHGHNLNLNFFLQLIERFNGRLPGYIGDGYDRESFCHVDDVVSGHIAAMEKGRVGQRYLLTGENMSFVQIFNMVANITNTKAPMFHVPLWLIEAYGWISVFVSHITGKLPLISYPVCPLCLHLNIYKLVIHT